ncbi:MAG: hypothetical protein Q7S60_05610 [bacterium]|nr:hypothetical protein [bacterium]
MLKEISRRRVIAGLAGGLGVAVLSACGDETPSTSERPAGTPAVTPIVGEAIEARAKALAAALKAAFMPRVVVESQRTPTAAATPTVAATESVVAPRPTPTAAPVVAEAPERRIPTAVAKKEAEKVLTGVMVPVPTSFRPEDNGGVQNVLLPTGKNGDTVPEVKEGVWFHPMTRLEFMGGQEIVWSYDYYYAHRSEDLMLVQHGGEEGRMIFRQNHSETAKLVLGVGRLSEFTDSQGVKKDLRGNVQGGEPMINIRTHPGVTVRAWNPDTGERLMVDGKPLEGVTSESGDVGFVLGKFGRFVLEADLPVDTGLETMVWEGPHDRTDLKLNILDARPAVQDQAVSPAESARGIARGL